MMRRVRPSVAVIAVSATAAIAGCGGTGTTATVSSHPSAQEVTNAIGDIVLNHFNDPGTVHCTVGASLATCATGSSLGSQPYVYDADISSDGTIKVHQLGPAPGQ
jgi:hypothetical protein